MFVIVELLYGNKEIRERKRELWSISSIVKCNIYEGRRCKDMY
jgi:hypothetical protein